MSFELPTKYFILLHTLVEAAELSKSVSTDRDGMGQSLQKRIDQAKDGWISWKPRNWTENSQSTEGLREFAHFLREHEQAGLMESLRAERTNRPLWCRLTPAGRAEALKLAEQADVTLPSVPESRSPADCIRWELSSFRKAARGSKPTK